MVGSRGKDYRNKRGKRQTGVGSKDRSVLVCCFKQKKSNIYHKKTMSHTEPDMDPMRQRDEEGGSGTTWTKIGAGGGTKSRLTFMAGGRQGEPVRGGDLINDGEIPEQNGNKRKESFGPA